MKTVAGIGWTGLVVGAMCLGGPAVAAAQPVAREAWPVGAVMDEAREPGWLAVAVTESALREQQQARGERRSGESKKSSVFRERPVKAWAWVGAGVGLGAFLVAARSGGLEGGRSTAGVGLFVAPAFGAGAGAIVGMIVSAIQK